MLVYGIPSFRLEKSVIEAEIEVLKAMGIEFKCGIEVGKDISLDDLRKEGYEAFYVAIGAQGSRKLNIKVKKIKWLNLELISCVKSIKQKIQI